MKKYYFLYIDRDNIEKKGYATLSTPIYNENRQDWYVEVFSSIDNRSYKIYGVDGEHALLMAENFLKDRYSDYKIKFKK
ncbi:MAG: hypothetical protein K6357_00230 [Elusimicrobiota bacterium]